MPGFYYIENLLHKYGRAASDSQAAVDIETLEIPLGGIVAIVGGSGSGKTTLLNLISGLETPDQLAGNNQTILDLCLPGETTVHQLASTAHISGAKDHFPRNRVSYVFQQGYLLNHASLRLNLAITRRAAGLITDKQSLDGLLSMAQLNNTQTGSPKLLSDRAITLSGGQQQRLNIARALGREPVLLFADEPTSSLDPHKASDVVSNLKKWIWNEADTATVDRTQLDRCMIWVTHDYQLAAEFADAVIVMKNGKLASGSERPIECCHTKDSVDAISIRSWVDTGVVDDRFVQSNTHVRRQHKSNAKPESQVGGELDRAPDHTYETAQAIPEHPIGASIKRLSKTRAAMENIVAGVQLSLMDSYRGPSTVAGPFASLRKRILTPVFGYGNWVRSLQLGAILSLIILVTYGQKAVIAYFDNQLNDPTLRHLIVNQNMRNPDLSVINEQSLQDLERVIASYSHATDAMETGIFPRSAFGRFTEYLSAYPRSVDTIADKYVAEIAVGVLDAEEPSYASLAVHTIDPDAPSCEGNEIQTPAELIPYDDELIVILTRRYMEDSALMFEADLCKNPEIDFWDKEKKTFRIAGFVDQPPADGYDNFDALMQIDVWRTWYSGMNKRQINNLSRAAVYFDRKNHELVLGELFERSFAFDLEIVNKFKRLMSASAQLRNTFFVLTWLSLIVAITVAAGLIWTYLMNNAKPIAILRAHDAWFWPLVSAIPFQLILAYIYAAFYMILAAVVWNTLVYQPWFVNQVSSLSGGDWIPSAIGWQHIHPTLPYLSGSLLAMIAAGWGCLGLWRVTHRKLAHELRQAH